jgi:predicted transcriptional regulator
MEKMVTISVKIPITWKERMKRSRIKASKMVRDLLERGLLEEEARKLDEDIKKHQKIFDKLSVEEVVKQIRKDRYGGH